MVSFVERLFPKNAYSNRDARYDYLRVLAAIGVIATHAIQSDFSAGLYANSRFPGYMIQTAFMLCMVCNPIYFMISGALLYRWKEESVADFYKKRASRVIIPMVLYDFFYLYIGGFFSPFSLNKVYQACVRLLKGETGEAPHFWILYMLLSVYLLIPFLRYMFKDMPYRILTFLVIISVAALGITTFTNFKTLLSFDLGQWLRVALVGYWLSRKETRKYDLHLMGIGVAGIVSMILLLKYNPENGINMVANTSPIMIMIGAGIFAFIFHFPKVFSKGNRIIFLLSKYSYSIILIHWYVLVFWTRDRFHIYSNAFHYLGIFASVAVTLLGSLLFAVVFDHTVVWLVTYCYNKLLRIKK